MSILDAIRAPTPDRFARALLRQLQAETGKTLVYDAGLSVIKSADQTFFIRIDTPFKAYRQASIFNRGRVLREQAKNWSAFASDPAPGTDPALLRPTLRTSDDIGLRRLQLRAYGIGADKLEIVGVPFLDPMQVVLTVDNGQNMAMLTPAQLAAMGLTPEAALARAVSNLRDMSGPPLEQILPGVYKSNWNDGYDDSRLLTPDILHRIGVRGNPVAMAPVRGTLLVAGAKDPAGISLLIEAAHQFVEGDNPANSPQLIVFDGDQPRRFEAENAIDQQSLAELTTKISAGMYAQQKKLLDQAHERENRDVFVASLMLLQKPGAPLISAATWTKGADSLLPKASHISFVEPDAQGMLLVPWDKATAIAGHLMTQSADQPVRYLVKDYPNRDQLAALKSASVA